MYTAYVLWLYHQKIEHLNVYELATFTFHCKFLTVIQFKKKKRETWRIMPKMLLKNKFAQILKCSLKSVQNK